MSTIKEVKKELKRREWAEQISECQSSGLNVKDWCRERGVSCNTYYSRLRILRTEALEKAGEDGQKIVPISLSAELNKVPVCADSQMTVGNSSNEKAVIRKDGIEIELPQNVSENIVLALLKGLKQC